MAGQGLNRYNGNGQLIDLLEGELMHTRDEERGIKQAIANELLTLNDLEEREREETGQLRALGYRFLESA